MDHSTYYARGNVTQNDVRFIESLTTREHSMDTERIVCIGILVASFIGFGTAAVVQQDEPENYGDGCFSSSTEFVVCEDVAYTPDMTVVLELCQTEDSDNCYWNATLQGNGNGKSFINFDGTTQYLN